MIMNQIMMTTMNKDLNTPIWQLTVGEFLELQEKVESKKEVVVKNIDTEQKRVYGIMGLANLLGCSKTTAGKLKASGKIDKAITQTGRIIVIDASLALQLAGRSGKKY